MTTSPVVTITEDLVAELECEVNDCREEIGETNMLTFRALLAERAELNRDAERYRWLRENVKTEFYGDQLADMFTCTGAKIDKLVDAAMQAAK